MTFSIVFRRAAKVEFEKAAVWYDEQRPGLGEEFMVEIEQAIVNAAAGPLRYQLVFGDIGGCGARTGATSAVFQQHGATSSCCGRVGIQFIEPPCT